MAVAEVFDLHARIHGHGESSLNERFLNRLERLTTEEGRELLRVCSTAPETASLMNLAGLYYREGPPSSRDDKKGAELYARAVALGDPLAINNLGLCYQNGTGVARDGGKAVELYSRAVALGNQHAMNNLGYCYQLGIGVPQDQRRATELYSRAVGLGNSNAMFNLGYCYAQAIGVPRDVKKATELYSRAIDLGDRFALNCLGQCYQNGLGVPRDMSKAVELYSRAVDLGDKSAMNNLGLCHKNGVGVARDEGKAVELFTRAGTATSMWHLGLCYKETDPMSAIMYFYRANSLYGEEMDKTDCRNAINGLLRDRDLQIAVLETVLGHEKKIETLEAEDRRNKEEIERLRAEVDYRPGGSGYMVARDDFLTKCPGRRRASI